VSFVFKSRAYRHDNEQLVLLLTILLVLGVIVLTSTFTFCLSGVLIIGMFIFSAVLIRSHHESLMRSALRVDPRGAPDLSDLVTVCARKLQPGPVAVYLVRQDQVNAYTFGVGTPKVLVLYTPLLRVMGPQELSFIIGHEMGHVALGHTWLNTIVGGLAGIPAPLGLAIILYTAFRWWNRMCEYSADRAGLLACGDLNTAVSALVKLVAPEVRTQVDFDRALAQIDAQDDQLANRVAEAFQSHPMLIRRINRLRAYARTEEYRRLQAGVNRNVGDNDPPPEGSFSIRQMDQPDPPEPPEDTRTPEERWPWLRR
jgi:Zn-dependent protease with chaperone function